MIKIRYYLLSYIKQGLLDMRVFLLLAGMFIYLQIQLHRMVEPMREMHMEVNPFTMIPSLLSVSRIYVMFFIVYVLWVDCFTFREDRQYDLIRMGKKGWYARQCVYCFLTALLLVAWLFISLMLIYNVQCDFSNTWGEMYQYAKANGEWPAIFYACESLSFHESLSPYLVSGIYGLLFILLATMLGILMMLLNLRFNKNVGAAVVWLIVMTNRILSESLSDLTRFNWLWDNFYPVKLAIPMRRTTALEQPLWQHLAYGSLYFLVCIGILWFVGNRVIKKVDFAQ